MSLHYNYRFNSQQDIRLKKFMADSKVPLSLDSYCIYTRVRKKMHSTVCHVGRGGSRQVRRMPECRRDGWDLGKNVCKTSVVIVAAIYRYTYITGWQYEFARGSRHDAYIDHPVTNSSATYFPVTCNYDKLNTPSFTKF